MSREITKKPLRKEKYMFNVVLDPTVQGKPTT